MFEFGFERVVARLFAQSFGFYVEDLRRVGFAEEEKAADLDECVGYACGVEDPAPGRLFRDEAACYGADGRTEKRG